MKTLSALRRAAGYNQRQVAQRLGVSQTTVSKWESGSALPRTDKLFLLGLLYGVKVDDIYLPGVEAAREAFLQNKASRKGGDD